MLEELEVLKVVEEFEFLEEHEVLDKGSLEL